MDIWRNEEKEDRGVVIETGGNPLATVAGLLIAAACLVAAWALWQMSVGLAIGAAALGVGVGGYNFFRGVAPIIYAWKAGNAEMIKAQGWADAARTRALAEHTRAKAELMHVRTQITNTFYLEDHREPQDGER